MIRPRDVIKTRSADVLAGRTITLCSRNLPFFNFEVASSLVHCLARCHRVQGGCAVHAARLLPLSGGQVSKSSLGGEW